MTVQVKGMLVPTSLNAFLENTKDTILKVAKEARIKLESKDVRSSGVIDMNHSYNFAFDPNGSYTITMILVEEFLQNPELIHLKLEGTLVISEVKTPNAHNSELKMKITRLNIRDGKAYTQKGNVMWEEEMTY